MNVYMLTEIDDSLLKILLSSGKSEKFKRTLDKSFRSVAKVTFAWLQELREHGYERKTFCNYL